jgi:hypothetical protein
LKPIFLSRAARLALLVLAAAAMARAEGPAPGPLAPAAGDVIPSFEAQSVDGAGRKITFDKGTTILAFFLSGCPACHKMIPEWNRAFQSLPPGVTMVGVLMDQEPPGFFELTPIAFPVVRSPGRAFLAGLKVHRAPTTLRVGPRGKVEQVAVGIVDPITMGQIFRR